MANLLSTNVTGTINSTGNTTAAGFTGNANVGGTGAATWHPSGIYVGNTQWLYGTQYRNNSATSGQGQLYFDGNYGYGMVGLYSAERYQAVFAMGDSYKLPVDGSGTGTLYGIAWTHTNVGGESKAGLGHQALFMMNGRTYTAIGSGIWTDGTITTTSHGTSANWNTAYGWGNHASAGYQAASTAITTSNIGSQSVNYAASAGAVAASAITGQTGMWTSAARPGAYRLYRNDDNSAYNVQTTWSADVSGYWSLRGYNGDTYHAPCYVGYAGYASSAGNADTVDNYHASNFLGKNGNAYYQADTWIQLNGGHGLYAPSYYSAHFYPNVDGTYTQWAMNGNKSGYGGIYDLYSRVNGFMYDGSGNGGVYREANGLWYFYYHVGNNCMGVGTSTTSSSYRMYVDGTIYATGDVIAYSDSRKKTNIVTIDNALTKVLSMRGVFYDKIDELQNGRQVGVIAQEVNEVLPEAVTYASDVDEYGVKYGNIVGVLIEAIKEQQAQIDDLKKRLGE
jgi:hypothetical protein